MQGNITIEPPNATTEPQDNTIGILRKWFRAAVDAAHEWRKEAQEDYDFVAGKQWSDNERKQLAESGRPPIVINRIKPLINILSGYQRLNRYDIDFLPRTNDDMAICQVRKGVTKYVLDRSDYDSQESMVFLDAVICGVGWFDVGYKFNDGEQDGEAYVRRTDPFGVYVDPEAHEPDFSDAKYICRATWADKDELTNTYPEHADAINAAYSEYDTAENDYDYGRSERLWYTQETKKARLVECWYKKRAKQTMLVLSDGQEVVADELAEQELQQIYIAGLVEGVKQNSVTKIKYALHSNMDESNRHGRKELSLHL